jgi:hypothetical protein
MPSANVPLFLRCSTGADERTSEFESLVHETGRTLTGKWQGQKACAAFLHYLEAHFGRRWHKLSCTAKSPQTLYPCGAAGDRMKLRKRAKNGRD